MALSYLKDAVTALSRLFYPHICELCGTELNGPEEVLCLHCSLALPRTGLHKHANNKVYQTFTGRIPVSRATAFTYFTKEGMMQHLLHRLKYKSRTDIADYLGKLFAADLLTTGWLEGIDLLIPVPLHRRKAYRRGFNQSDFIADGMALTAGLPVDKAILSRVQDTESQTRKTRLERIDNVSQVFRVQKPELINGKHILLIDDVLTTGATLEAAGLALLEAGAANLSMAALALASD
jgi:ComF family protein